MIQRGLFALLLPIMVVLFIPWLAVASIVALVMIPIAVVHWVVSGKSGSDLYL